MNMKTTTWISIFVCLSQGITNAASRSSANYSMLMDTVAVGGGLSTSLNYSSDTAISGPCGTGTGHPIINLAGPIPRRPQVTQLAISVPTTNVHEGGSLQFTATARYDDGTYADVTATGARWNAGNPLTVSTNGWVSAGAVYQTGFGTAQASYIDYVASFGLLVMNTNTDDFGSYAGDGLNDAWQVQYFGLNSPNAGPNSDPDGDGQNNNYESTVGTLPTDASSRFQLGIERVPGQPTWRNLTFSPAFPNRSYQLQHRMALNAGFTPFGRLPATTNGTVVTVTDTNATDAVRFYRVRVTQQ
jgi:hypothetical protein